MSKFVFICPECGKSILTDEQGVGEVAACPKCEKPITIPEFARVSKRHFPQSVGRETTMRNLGVLVLVLCILAAIIAILCCGYTSSDGKFQWNLPVIAFAAASVITGLVQFCFFSWAGELLAAVKKIAGLGYDPEFFKTYHSGGSEDTCALCSCVVTAENKWCPGCKRPLLWPEKET